MIDRRDRELRDTRDRPGGILLVVGVLAAALLVGALVVMALIDAAARPAAAQGSQWDNVRPAGGTVGRSVRVAFKRHHRVRHGARTRTRPPMRAPALPAKPSPRFNVAEAIDAPKTVRSFRILPALDVAIVLHEKRSAPEQPLPPIEAPPVPEPPIYPPEIFDKRSDDATPRVPLRDRAFGKAAIVVAFFGAVALASFYGHKIFRGRRHG